MNDADKVAIARWALWQFNEATSLLREARSHLSPGLLADEINEGLPNIQEALEALARALDNGETA